MNPDLTSPEVGSAQYRWFDSALGQYAQKEEQPIYDQAVFDLFGFNALQMGALKMDLLRNSRIACRYQSTDLITPLTTSQSVDLYCNDDFLPLADMSLDLLLLPHCLEFSERPHQTLREAERVMMPEGHLLISGFNPLSLWGLTRVFKNMFFIRDANAHHYPWNGRFISLNRLKDWLALLGFEVVSVDMCCHVPPVEQESWRRRLRFMHPLCRQWLPGGVYVVVAKKRVVGMTPLKPNWSKPSLAAGLVAGPTKRKPNQHESLEEKG